MTKKDACQNIETIKIYKRSNYRNSKYRKIKYRNIVQNIEFFKI
jgi:hypothetical protein